jgi:ABC-type dipeptide/oligopeptide/nickel transport system permease component
LAKLECLVRHDVAAHLVLPVIVLGTSGMAGLMRLMRSNILEIKSADYVRTARAKGLPESQVVGKHVLRNALNPFVTLAGYELGTLLGGAALVEAVMNLQGLGTLLLEGETLHEVPGHVIDVVDTTGAGDVFRGAFIYALLRGDAPAAILRFANAAAAMSCTREGAMASVPRLGDVE